MIQKLLFVISVCFLLVFCAMKQREITSLKTAFSNYASYYSEELQIANSERIKMREEISSLKLKCELSDELLSRRIDILVSVLSGGE